VLSLDQGESNSAPCFESGGYGVRPQEGPPCFAVFLIFSLEQMTDLLAD
jgi:hypothetical protein